MAWNTNPNYAPGNLTVNEGYVPAYQGSGKPYAETITTSTTAQEIKFPTVSRWIQVANLGGTGEDLLIGFSEHGVAGTENDYFYRLKPAADGGGSTGRLELKCKSVWIKSSTGTPVCSVIAGLTNIGDLTTALTGSKGVG